MVRLESEGTRHVANLSGLKQPVTGFEMLRGQPHCGPDALRMIEFDVQHCLWPQRLRVI